ncbi:MAG: hypothetical protein ACTSQG_02255 [Promethearchaeota archaeon]
MKSMRNEKKVMKINKKEEIIEDIIHSGVLTKGQYLGLTGDIIVVK